MSSVRLTLDRQWQTDAGPAALLFRVVSARFFSYWLGYVEVPSDSSLYEKEYTEAGIKVRGNLTYSGRLSDMPEYNPQNGWFLGFDTASFRKLETRAFCVYQCEELARQIVETDMESGD
jgi:hypothetical protein